MALQARSGQPPVFVNSITQEPGRAHWLTFHLWFSCPIGAELHSCNRGHMALRAENIYYLALCQRPS